MMLHVPKDRLFRPGIGLVALVLLASAAFALSARADPPHPKRKDEYKRQVEKLEEVWRTAQLNADVDAMDKLLSDDYVGITMTGQVVTKMQQLDRLRNRSIVLTKIDLSDVKVRMIGTTAIVTSLADVDGTNDGEPIHGSIATPGCIRGCLPEYGRSPTLRPPASNRPRSHAITTASLRSKSRLRSDPLRLRGVWGGVRARQVECEQPAIERACAACDARVLRLPGQRERDGRSWERRWVTVVTGASGRFRESGEEVWERVLLGRVAIIPPGSCKSPTEYATQIRCDACLHCCTMIPKVT